MTSGSSMQAMLLTWRTQVLLVSMSILNTRFRRWAEVMTARRSAGVGPSVASGVIVLLPSPRLTGVNRARCSLLGASTPWNRVKLTLGLGTNAASRADEAQGLKNSVLGAIAVRRLELVTNVAIGRERQALFRHRSPGDVAAQTFQLLAFIRPGRDPRMQRKSRHLAHCVIGRFIADRQGLQGEHLAARLRAHGDAIRDRSSTTADPAAPASTASPAR